MNEPRRAVRTDLHHSDRHRLTLSPPR